MAWESKSGQTMTQVGVLIYPHPALWAHRMLFTVINTSSQYVLRPFVTGEITYFLVSFHQARIYIQHSAT